MKLVVLLSVFLSGAMAQACLGEAQIIAKLSSVQQTPTACVAKISGKNVSFYSENMICPLDLVDVEKTVVVLGATCVNQAGDEVSGVIAKTSDGSLVLGK